MACLLAGSAVRAGEPSPKPALAKQEGTLEIVGKGIENLVIGGPLPTQEHVFDRPGSSVPLPAGRYWVKDVILLGGFQRRYPGPGPSQFTIVPGQSCRVEIPTQLVSTVNFQRRGSVLKLGYTLIGADGFKYSSRERSDPPRFTVYQGGREIGSGSFEYG